MLQRLAATLVLWLRGDSRAPAAPRGAATAPGQEVGRLALVALPLGGPPHGVKVGHFAETRSEVLHRLIEERPLGTLVTLGADGLDANHLPFEFDPEPLSQNRSAADRQGVTEGLRPGDPEGRRSLADWMEEVAARP